MVFLILLHILLLPKVSCLFSIAVRYLFKASVDLGLAARLIIPGFIYHLKETAGIEVTLVSAGRFALYNSYLPGNKHAPRLAEKIVAIFKIRHATPPDMGKKITQSSDAYDLVRDLGNLDHEQFDLLLLSQANNVINRICHSKCGIAGTIVDKRLILLDILRNKAAAEILAHKHPSGNLTPSKADIDITKQVKDACKMIGVSVLDHIIVASEHPSRYTSLADEGHM